LFSDAESSTASLIVGNIGSRTVLKKFFAPHQIAPSALADHTAVIARYKAIRGGHWRDLNEPFHWQTEAVHFKYAVMDEQENYNTYTKY